jgi:hypothetical protein
MARMNWIMRLFMPNSGDIPGRRRHSFPSLEAMEVRLLLSASILEVDSTSLDSGAAAQPDPAASGDQSASSNDAATSQSADDGSSTDLQGADASTICNPILSAGLDSTGIAIGSNFVVNNPVVTDTSDPPSADSTLILTSGVDSGGVAVDPTVASTNGSNSNLASVGFVPVDSALNVPGSDAAPGDVAAAGPVPELSGQSNADGFTVGTVTDSSVPVDPTITNLVPSGVVMFLPPAVTTDSSSGAESDGTVTSDGGDSTSSQTDGDTVDVAAPGAVIDQLDPLPMVLTPSFDTVAGADPNGVPIDVSQANGLSLDNSVSLAADGGGTSLPRVFVLNFDSPLPFGRITNVDSGEANSPNVTGPNSTEGSGNAAAAQYFEARLAPATNNGVPQSSPIQVEDIRSLGIWLVNSNQANRVDQPVSTEVASQSALDNSSKSFGGESDADDSAADTTTGTPLTTSALDSLFGSDLDAFFSQLDSLT